VEEVPATSEQRGVVLGRVLAGQPERVRVRLVPDHDVPDLAVPEQGTADETAVVLASLCVMRRIGSAAVDPEHRSHAVATRGDRTAKCVVVGAGQVPLPRTPLERHAHATEIQRLHRAEDSCRLFGPLDAVVVDPDQRSDQALGPDEQGQEQERERRSYSHLLLIIGSGPNFAIARKDGPDPPRRPVCLDSRR
jgi:hypothetical protein